LIGYWKIGAVSGLVAGFVFGIAWEFMDRLAVSIGLYEPWFRPFIINNIGINIPVGIIFGIILGIIYSKVYSLVPRRGIVKGVIYGLFLFFICTVRLETFDVAYGRYLLAVGSYLTDSFTWFLFGLVLGILYDELSCGGKYPAKEEFSIVEYKMRSGLLPGAIAGFVGGAVGGILIPVGAAMGFIPDAPKTLTFDFFLSEAGSHILVNMVWGLVFGAIFAKVYNLVPSKGLLKGICYGLIVYLIADVQYGVYLTLYGVKHGSSLFALYMAYSLLFGGFFVFLFFGVVLGLLYRKPSD
jgi:hypothetical protein